MSAQQPGGSGGLSNDALALVAVATMAGGLLLTRRQEVWTVATGWMVQRGLLVEQDVVLTVVPAAGTGLDAARLVAATGLFLWVLVAGSVWSERRRKALSRE